MLVRLSVLSHSSASRIDRALTVSDCSDKEARCQSILDKDDPHMRALIFGAGCRMTSDSRGMH